MQTGQEKRRFPRVERQIAVIYRFDLENRRFEDACRTMNISAGGVALESGRAIALNTRIVLKLLVENRIVFCRGRVVHLEPAADNSHYVGVELDPEAHSDPAFASFLSSQKIGA